MMFFWLEILGYAMQGSKTNPTLLAIQYAEKDLTLGELSLFEWKKEGSVCINSVPVFLIRMLFRYVKFLQTTRERKSNKAIVHQVGKATVEHGSCSVSFRRTTLKNRNLALLIWFWLWKEYLAWFDSFYA